MSYNHINTNNCFHNIEHTKHNEYYLGKDTNYVHLFSKCINENEMDIYTQKGPVYSREREQITLFKKIPAIKWKNIL